VISVGVVDDHLIARLGLEQVFADAPDIEVTASVGTIEEVSRLPDVLIVDLYLGTPVPALTRVRLWVPCTPSADH
jgi:DNA-binding NarL/FixJ family response regulator